MRYMGLNTSIAVRFDPYERKLLEQISTQTGLSVSDLVRRAARDYVERVQREGQVSLPVALVAAEPKPTYGKKKEGVADER